MAMREKMKIPEYEALVHVVDKLSVLQTNTERYILNNEDKFANENDRDTNARMLNKLYLIWDDLGSKTLTYSLLRTIPNTTFENIFKKVGQRVDDTIRYCSNDGKNCKTFTEVNPSLFPKCFDYDTQEHMTGSSQSDEGISAGVTMVFMTGRQFVSIAVEKSFQKETYQNEALFTNTFSPYSSDGLRLVISPPGPSRRGFIF